MITTIIEISAATLLSSGAVQQCSSNNLNNGNYQSDPPWGLDRTVLYFKAKLTRVKFESQIYFTLCPWKFLLKSTENL